MTPTLIVVIAAIALLPLVLGILFKVLWKVPAADQALIVTGFGVKGRRSATAIFKIVTGGGAFVVPVMQKAQYLSMSADKALLEVEGVDIQKIPVGVRGVAIFKVGDDERSITNAGTRFLEAQKGQMHDLVREVFHGHLRSIIGGLSVEDLIANRNELAQATRDASSDEMQKLGLVIDSLQIQEIIDPTGYIRALGEPRAAEVKMKARIAQAAADREATEREQEAEALKAAARRDSEIKRAAYQAEIDKQAAISAQAGPLADAEARKQVVVQETAVAELVADREEKRLDSQVRKPADAAAYEKQVQAEAERVARISIAEAQAREVELAAAAKAKQIEQIGTSEARIRASAASPRARPRRPAVRPRARRSGPRAWPRPRRSPSAPRRSRRRPTRSSASSSPSSCRRSSRAAAESFKHVDNLTILQRRLEHLEPAARAARAATASSRAPTRTLSGCAELALARHARPRRPRRVNSCVEPEPRAARSTSTPRCPGRS